MIFGKKFILIGILMLHLGFGGIQLATAQDTPSDGQAAAGAESTGGEKTLNADEQKKALTNEEFNVTNYLKAPGQEQSYFHKNDKNESGESVANSHPNAIASAIVEFINFLVLSIGSVSFLSIVIGGLTYMTSHGNETQINKGKEIITYAVIGLVISLSAYFITAFVQGIFYEI